MLLVRILIFLMLTCSLTWAKDNDRLINYPPGKLMGFRGLDTLNSAPNIPDSRAADLLNVKLSGALDLKKRPGMDTINNASLDDLEEDSPAVTGIFDSLYSDNTSHTYVFSGKKLWYDNGGTWTVVNGPGAITSGQNNQFKCIMALDEALCTNDVDPIIQINKTPFKDALDVSNLSDALTKAKSMIWYRNYLILGNTVEAATERPTRFRWSNVGTIETWTDDDFVDISTFAGDEIVGFAELYGELYIFLTESIWKASLVGGDDLFVFKKVIDGTGTIARDSMQIIQLSENRTAVAFINDLRQVYLFDGVSLVDIGRIIQPTLDTLNEARLQYIVSAFDGQNYFFCGTLSGSTSNDICFEWHSEIFEWSKHDQIDANAMARVKENTSTVKTYVGNYDDIVYWMDNPDLNNDVDGATGVVESVGTLDTATMTGAQIIIDSDMTSGIYTGAIIKITSGTGAGQEEVIADHTTTGVIVAQAFTTTPDSTSVYSIGDINAYYYAKHYEMGDATKEKNAFLGMLLWAAEDTSNAVDVSYAVDFGSNLGSSTVDLSPASASLWDSAIWDTSVWGTTGDKLYTVKFSGFGNFIQPKFENNTIDETFHLYGFNLIATVGDTKQP